MAANASLGLFVTSTSDSEHLVTVGRSAAALLRRELEWIHRRVESIDFLASAGMLFRRSVSIDFTIPHSEAFGERAAGARTAGRYWVPLSFIAKSPPTPRFDMRGPDGLPAPLLTTPQNRLLDSAVLTQLARDTPNVRLSSEDESAIDRIVATGADDAAAHLDALFPPGSLPEPWATLRGDPVFMLHAHTLCTNAMLWFRIDGQSGDRIIVKFAYEVYLRQQVDFVVGRRVRPVFFPFDTPHAGGASDYHLTVTLPEPMAVSWTEIVLWSPQSCARAAEEPRDAQVRYHLDSRQKRCSCNHAPGSDLVQLHVASDLRQVTLEVSGERTGLAGKVFVAARPGVVDFVRVTTAAALGLTAMLILFATRLSNVVENSSAAAAVLVLGPALVAFLWARPLSYFVADRAFRGLRRLSAPTAAWPVLGAGLLAISGNHPSLWVRVSLYALAAAALINAVALVLAARKITQLVRP